jgi:hypothetical protein
MFIKKSVDQADVDDLAARKVEIEQAGKILQYGERLRAAQRYAQMTLPDESELASVRSTLDLVRTRLKHLNMYLSNEAQLLSELLDPATDAINSYSVRYLQVFDRVVSTTEQARISLQQLCHHPEYITLSRLERVSQLASGAALALESRFTEAATGDALFPANITRAYIERELGRSPQPLNCPLTLDNASSWIAAASWSLEECRAALHEVLRDKAALLTSDALRGRLVQGAGMPFIDALLAADSPEALAQVLVDQIGALSEDDAARPLDLLRRYLQRITVCKVRLSDFKPSKHTIEQVDVPMIVEEFAEFLSGAFGVDEDDELPVVEIE